MNRMMAPAVRGAVTRAALAGVLMGVAATGAAVPAYATWGSAGRTVAPAPLQAPDPGGPTSPDDPRCIVIPELPVCQGGPYDGVPTSPSDPACISQPLSPICQGGPYAPPPALVPAPPPPAAPAAPPVIAPPG